MRARCLLIGSFVVTCILVITAVVNQKKDGIRPDSVMNKGVQKLRLNQLLQEEQNPGLNHKRTNRIVVTSETTGQSKSLLLSGNGTLLSGAAVSMGLDSHEVEGAQREITRFWKSAEASTASRAIFDSEASDETAKRDVYRIPALPDRGKAAREELRNSLAGIIGQGHADLLVNGLDEKPFGGFGKYDVLLEFKTDESSDVGGADHDSIMVNYTYLNPTNGLPALKGTSTMSGFSERFGNWAINK